MKYILLIIFCTLLYSCSRSITGVVHLGNSQKETAYIYRDTVKKYNEYLVNLTLKEISIKMLDQGRKFNSKNSSLTNKTGIFTIKAKTEDTLYFKAWGYYTKSYSVKDLLKMKYIYVKLDEIPCDEPTVICTDTVPKLHIVIAEKINLKRYEDEYCKNEIPFDSKYGATYKILENVYGDYKEDTITFTIYDHNGHPQFTEYDTVLLYIGEYCGELIHVKYQFSDLYKTADGQWASPLSPWEYGRLKPGQISNYTKIAFEPPIRYSADYDWTTPEEYFGNDSDSTTALYGRYVEDIVSQMKETKLKSFEFSFD